MTLNGRSLSLRHPTAKEIDVTATPFSVLTRGISRRDVLLGAASVAALGVAMGATPVLAQGRAAGPDEVPIEELMKPGALPDLILGKADAP